MTSHREKKTVGTLLEEKMSLGGGSTHTHTHMLVVVAGHYYYSLADMSHQAKASSILGKASELKKFQG